MTVVIDRSDKCYLPMNIYTILMEETFDGRSVTNNF